MRKFLFGVLGLTFWLVTQWIALGIGAGVADWNEPVWLSMFLVLLYPIAFIRAFCGATGPTRLDRYLLLLGAVLDVLMLGSMFLSKEALLKSSRIFPENYLWLALWLGLWAGWQLLVLASLITNRRALIDAERS